MHTYQALIRTYTHWYNYSTMFYPSNLLKSLEEMNIAVRTFSQQFKLDMQILESAVVSGYRISDSGFEYRFRSFFQDQVIEYQLLVDNKKGELTFTYGKRE